MTSILKATLFSLLLAGCTTTLVPPCPNVTRAPVSAINGIYLNTPNDPGSPSLWNAIGGTQDNPKDLVQILQKKNLLHAELLRDGHAIDALTLKVNTNASYLALAPVHEYKADKPPILVWKTVKRSLYRCNDTLILRTVLNGTAFVLLIPFGAGPETDFSSYQAFTQSEP